MIHDEIVTFEVAKLAKKNGFNEECREFYCEDKSQKRITIISCNRHVTSFDYCSNPMLEDYYPPHEYCYIAAPTQSLLQRWLRDNGFGEVEVRHYSETNKYPHHYGWEVKDNLGVLMSYSSKMFATYELALEQALKYSLENLC